VNTYHHYKVRSRSTPTVGAQSNSIDASCRGCNDAKFGESYSYIDAIQRLLIIIVQTDDDMDYPLNYIGSLEKKQEFTQLRGIAFLLDF
jgi:hypothetical protein